MIDPTAQPRQRARAKPLPLSKRECRILRDARRYGVYAFSWEADIVTNRQVSEVMAGMTDNQRALWFDQIEGVICLVESLRGAN